MHFSNKFLTMYSGVLTIAFGAIVLTAASAGNTSKLEILDVQRINLREPDGTLRMVISSSGRFPGAIIAGKEYPHERTQAGMLFFDDEGSENGGLIFDGKKIADGTASSVVSLTFDRYRQDQQLQLLGVDQNGGHFAGMTINDVIDGTQYPAFSPGSEQDKDGKPAITRRLYIGKTPGGASALMLADATGKPRLNILVSESGEGSITFLDATGKPVRKITAKELADDKSATGKPISPTK